MISFRAGIGRSALLAGLFVATGTPAQDPPKAADAKVAVKIVKYPELGDAVKQLRGQVVVVDFWALG